MTVIPATAATVMTDAARSRHGDHYRQSLAIAFWTSDGKAFLLYELRRLCQDSLQARHFTLRDRKRHGASKPFLQEGSAATAHENKSLI